jgi:hypothetical protein
MFEIASMGGWPPGDAAWQAMIAAWFLGVAVIVLPAIAGRHVAWIRPDLLPAWRMIHAFVGVLFVMGSALSRPAPWDAWTTVIWALAGIVVFLAGLFLRARTHRIAGLLVLGACLPRIFFVDINSTLYRIAAFVVVGLVLLWVGFSYQRFRHLIDNDADRSEPPGKDSD